MSIFKQMESNVQCYANSFPVTFNRAKGAYLYDNEGNAYLDFLAGAGSLNYGHNQDELKQALVDYIMQDGVAHGLDMHTDAKAAFMQTLQDVILKPRGLDYKVQFTGPTGANAVEAALKLARKVTGRTNVISFTNGFHGVTLGAVSATGNQHHRGGASIPLSGVTRMPYCGYYGYNADTLKMLDKQLSDPSSGIDAPAAFIVETVQGEGGLNVATPEWLLGLQNLAKKHGALLIVDDIQAGCGRTGKFFSFEEAGLKPDIVTLSKSLSGFGLPLAIVLFKPELDEWAPGEHNGTFRGNNHAFITAKTALETYWADQEFEKEIQQKAELVHSYFQSVVDELGVTHARLKGRGLMQGIEFRTGDIADSITSRAFEKGLIIETAGNQGQVVKCFCPLTIETQDLEKGLKIVVEAIAEEFNTSLKMAS
ncbi:diaminobutyrate--2-oxoglutarate aminotransferase [Catenovulum agarivorans DS-2]|uniref:Diaminobutyrate--2-oxoglutarate transaminase n=1 Tax=Catenovulum agarivorans DS-2 TaxID=1328313 RepID=W7R0T9_9ALTE|nr:diaminobutyrate--2-oxoglutarate transaminase [Catenovulum agarivorans]EWH11220.1 diaminobutyrate--2-oxoglutarate aminotransferase [Catenovulum agarivorans DS-2]